MLANEFLSRIAVTNTQKKKKNEHNNNVTVNAADYANSQSQRELLLCPGRSVHLLIVNATQSKSNNHKRQIKVEVAKRNGRGKKPTRKERTNESKNMANVKKWWQE